jgi:hypothetical protein
MMIEFALTALIVLFIFAAGFCTCYFFAGKQRGEPRAPATPTEVRRVKTSLRNPLRTYEVFYEPYKAKDTQLYQPVKPRRKAAVNEVETDGEE